MYLYHYFEKNKGPFLSITDLPAEEGMAIQLELRKDKALFASQRSDDYLSIRRELEQRCRSLFIEKGGVPKRNTPLYMTLGECSWLKEWYKEADYLKIHIEAFDSRTISFTYGDLFPTMKYQDGKLYRGNVYTKAEIFDLITQYGLPQVWNKYGDKGPERYIEVQVWDDEPLKEFIDRPLPS